MSSSPNRAFRFSSWYSPTSNFTTVVLSVFRGGIISTRSAMKEVIIAPTVWLPQPPCQSPGFRYHPIKEVRTLDIAVVEMKFFPGKVVSTPGALEAFRRSGEEPFMYLVRHLCGDWGEMPPDDCESNDRAIGEAERIMSSYILRDGTAVWVITEHDRSSTTFLLPEDY